MKILAMVLGSALWVAMCLSVLAVALWAVRLETEEELLSRPIQFYDVRADDVATVFDQLARSGTEESFAIFAFFPRDLTAGSHVELQFSIEGGKVGFDWVLLGEIKHRDRERFLEHAYWLGHDTQQLEVNGVRYIRVEDGDLVGLCRSIMLTFYGVLGDTPMELIARDFKVEGFAHSTQ